MSRVQLIYASTAADNIKLTDLRDILTIAKVHNKTKEITGFLCADKHYFLQCLEGEKSGIDALYEHIGQDERHHDLKVLSYRDIEFRSFPEWSMGGVLDIEHHKEILGKFNSDQKFDPYGLDADESLNMLKEFSSFRAMTG